MLLLSMVDFKVHPNFKTKRCTLTDLRSARGASARSPWRCAHWAPREATAKALQPPSRGPTARAGAQGDWPFKGKTEPKTHGLPCSSARWGTVSASPLASHPRAPRLPRTQLGRPGHPRFRGAVTERAGGGGDRRSWSRGVLTDTGGPHETGFASLGSSKPFAPRPEESGFRKASRCLWGQRQKVGLAAWSHGGSCETTARPPESGTSERPVSARVRRFWDTEAKRKEAVHTGSTVYPRPTGEAGSWGRRRGQGGQHCPLPPSAVPVCVQGCWLCLPGKRCCWGAGGRGHAALPSEAARVRGCRVGPRVSVKCRYSRE